MKIHFESLNVEQKQHLNLSDYAWEVIQEDRGAFRQDTHDIRLTTFLNRVFELYRGLAAASISQTIDKWREDFLVDSQSAQMARLLQRQTERLLESAMSYPTGSTAKFRLNKRNYEALFEEYCPEANYYKRAGSYIKAVIEEYARKPPLERESIYFRNEINEIMRHIQNGSRLLLRIWNGQVYEVKPYAVMSDNRSMYHYLAGFSVQLDDPNAELKVSSYRLSRILQIKGSPSRLTGKLTQKEKNALEERLKAVGIQFLVGNQERIVVRLTQAGVRMFQTQNHLRPRPNKVEKGIYYFECSVKQAESYFFKFGGEAEVLEPESLRIQFREQYKLAVQHYTDI